jgi:2-polyprenyl-3-methyl-5-hydroxy-6-metoxy-1,4-benzoquinol methylase
VTAGPSIRLWYPSRPVEFVAASRAGSRASTAGACPLCLTPSPRWFEKSGRTIARCPACRVVFVPEGLARTASGATIYESDDPVFLADGNEAYYLDDEGSLASAQEKVDWVGGHVAAGARILDVGAGFGHFLQAASSRFSATGLELGPAAVERARARAGVSCMVGSVYAMPAELERPFDAVTAWDFIEHVPDPMGALAAMSAAVRPGGHLFLSTPDAGSLAARVLGRHWHYLDPLQHLVLFGRANLESALVRAGFEPIAWRSFGHHYRMRYVFDRLRYLHPGGPLGWGLGLGRRLAAPFMDRLVYVRLQDVLGVAARRRA